MSTAPFCGGDVDRELRAMREQEQRERRLMPGDVIYFDAAVRPDPKRDAIEGECVDITDQKRLPAPDR